MTEILTESFCERCGTRYTFESVASHQKRMGGIRVLGRGLRNFVMSDDSSLDEAMAAARSDEEREATAQQLDAFHRTFNFCMSCRQYTCGNCWNGVEARCLSCSPMADAGVAIGAPEEAVDLDRLLRLTASPAETGWPAATESEPGLVGWGEVSVHADAPGDSFEAVEALEPTEAAEVAEPVTAEALEVEAAETLEVPQAAGAALPDWARISERVAADEPVVEEPLAAEPALRGLEPGESLEDAIAAYEAAQAAAATSAVGAGPGVDVVEQPTWPSTLAAADREAPPIEAAEVPEVAEVVTAEPQPAERTPIAVEPEPEPERQPAPVAEAEPEPIAAAAAAAPAEPAPAPEVPAPAQPLPPASVPAPTGTPSGPPQWPTGPRWPTAIPAHQTLPPPSAGPGPVADPLAAIMARQATEAMWAASSRDVIQPPLVAQAAPVAGVQPCVSCGISLSANARFCRRCGTSQLG